MRLRKAGRVQEVEHPQESALVVQSRRGGQEQDPVDGRRRGHDFAVERGLRRPGVRGEMVSFINHQHRRGSQMAADLVGPS